MAETVKQEPVWQGTPEDAGEELPPHSETDVCIVGAGIAGLSVAYHLTRAGKRVIVLDDGPVGGGQTFCTSAHLSSILDDRFSELEEIRGAAAARAAYESHAAAIDAIERAVRDEGIDCAFRRLDGYLFPAPGEPADTIRREEQAARRAGAEVSWLGRLPIDGPDSGPCLRFAGQARFQPMRYLAGLAGAVRRRGGKIFTGAHAARFRGGRPASVTTADGKFVGADALVVATNTPVNDRFAIHTKQAPYLTYMLALEVPPGAVPDALYWDTHDPYHYVRLAEGPGGETLLLVGGEDHKTGQARDQPDRFRRLEAWAREWFPAAGRVTNRWSGQVMETLDGLGFIGRNPADDENVYVVTGDSGMGLTHGTIAGLLLTDLILGRKNPWAELYDPSRKTFGALRTFLRENANVAAQYTAWLTAGDVASADEIPPGSGAVLRSGLSKYAVYRDERGELHTCSARCPHLGAVVTWNPSEKTWDCPAHGSRFAPDGRVIQGPANTGLQPVAEKQPAR